MLSERILNNIKIIRNRKVILDADLATLYGVTTKRLNEQVKRNRDRFPTDFMFQLNKKETDLLRSQIATSKTTQTLRWSQSQLPLRYQQSVNPVDLFKNILTHFLTLIFRLRDIFLPSHVEYSLLVVISL